MHYDLIIISNNNITTKNLKNFNYLILNEDYFLQDEYHVDDYSFDYVIISNLNSLKNIEILMEDNKVVTNCFFQTNFEHIFAIGQLNNSQKSFDEQLKVVLEFLNEPM